MHPQLNVYNFQVPWRAGPLLCLCPRWASCTRFVPKIAQNQSWTKPMPKTSKQLLSTGISEQGVGAPLPTWSSESTKTIRLQTTLNRYSLWASCWSCYVKAEKSQVVLQEWKKVRNILDPSRMAHSWERETSIPVSWSMRHFSPHTMTQ